jgi:hypothetical protein
MSKTVAYNTNIALMPANSIKANLSGVDAYPQDVTFGNLQFAGNAGTGLAAVTLSASGGLNLSTSGNTLIISGSGYLAKTTAKAWVNFNGTTATPSTIRSSYNVSSIAKNGTGDYTVNLAAPMADANYCVNFCFGASGNGAATYSANLMTVYTAQVRIRIFSVSNAPVLQDADLSCVAIFGN